MEQLTLSGNTLENDSYDGGQNGDYRTIGNAKTYLVTSSSTSTTTTTSSTSNSGVVFSAESRIL
ncbi:MAG: hypothetical protein ACRDF4_03485 [Rhabdochlamydiaceae bacterium]